MGMVVLSAPSVQCGQTAETPCVDKQNFLLHLALY